MDSNTGFGANGSPFEYAVAEAKTTSLKLKKIALVALYVLWGASVLVVGMVTKMLAPFIALVPLSTWVLVFFTWRYTQVEYEYSFFSGTMTVSRVLGNRTRKVLLKIAIRELSAVFPYIDANVDRANAYDAERTVFAASSMEAENLYIALWQDEDTGKRSMLCFEANEKALKILRYYNTSAMAK